MIWFAKKMVGACKLLLQVSQVPVAELQVLVFQLEAEILLLETGEGYDENLRRILGRIDELVNPYLKTEPISDKVLRGDPGMEFPEVLDEEGEPSNLFFMVLQGEDVFADFLAKIFPI